MALHAAVSSPRSKDRPAVRRRAAVAALLGGLALAATAARAEGWTIELLYGNDEIYPSVLVGATEKSPFPPAHPRQLGDPRALVAAEFPPQAAARRVTVTVDETEIFERSSIAVTLPASNLPQRVAPPLVLKHDKIFALRQPIARALLEVSVTTAAGTERKFKSVRVRAVTDWIKYLEFPAWMKNEAAKPAPRQTVVKHFESKSVRRAAEWLASLGPPPWLARYVTEELTELNWLSTTYLVAAFANENSPRLGREVIRWAMISEPEVAYRGYEGDAQGRAERVKAQVGAVYRALHAKGFKYSALTQASLDETTSFAQRVRLGDDALAARQANCIDGTLFFAAILMQLQLRPYLYISHSHAFLGVALDPAGAEILPMETTLVATEPFEQAVKSAQGSLDKAPPPVPFAGRKAEEIRYSTDKRVFFQIDLAGARSAGIVPIGEPPGGR